MELLKLLSSHPSRFVTDMAVKYIGDDKERFAILVEYLLSGEPPIPHRAAWALTVCTEHNPELIMPHIEVLIQNIPNYYHPGIIRMVLRSFAIIEIPEYLQGTLFDLCLKYANDKTMPIAVKVNALEVLFNISRKEPSLKQEVLWMLDQYIFADDKALKARANLLYKRLMKPKSSKNIRIV